MSNLGLIERARQMLKAATRSSAGPFPAGKPKTAKEKATGANRTAKRNPKPIWMETEASVTGCHRELVEIKAFHSRKANDSKTFTVSFTYYAHARTYYDRFASNEVKAQGERFLVFYNAFDPKQNAKPLSHSENRCALSAISIVSYILVSVLFLMMAHG